MSGKSKAKFKKSAKKFRHKKRGKSCGGTHNLPLKELLNTD
jgi:hypothetical protein